MRLIGKLLALPFMLVTGILYLVCKFFSGSFRCGTWDSFWDHLFWRHWCCSLSQDFCRVLHGL